MKIEFDTKLKILYFFAENKREDKISNREVREWFNRNAFYADRCWKGNGKIQGVRVYLTQKE